MAAAPPKSSGDPWLGRVLGGRYRVVRALGAGGAGAVYEAQELPGGSAVALKILHADLAADAVQLGRFRREAHAAEAIGHPNIAKLLAFSDARPGEPAFLVLELVQGRSLVEILARQPILAPARAVALATQILGGLEAAHRAGVVHRDLKPGNVVVDETPGRPETCKLVDFGIAQVHESPAYQKLTRTGVIVGTPRYMSPEQASGRPIDGRTDVWALGVMLYRMLSGDFPFDGRADQIILQIMKHDPPAFASELAVPTALEAVVRRALEKDVARRWPSALAMEAALRVALGEIPPTKEVRAPRPREEARTEAIPRFSIEELGRISSQDRTTEDPRPSFVEHAQEMGASPTRNELPDKNASRAPAPDPRTSATGSRPSGPTPLTPRIAPAATAARRASGVRVALWLVVALAIGTTLAGCIAIPWIGAAFGLWEWTREHTSQAR